MKKLLYLVTLAGFCGQPSYAMDQKNESARECENCIKVGQLKIGILAAQLGAMHAGQPLQQISTPVQTREKDTSDALNIKSPSSSVTHASSALGRTEADVSSENESDGSWDNECWSDTAEWEDLGNKDTKQE